MWKIVIPQNTDATFSPNGQYMAVSGEESFVRIWDVNNWVELPRVCHQLGKLELAIHQISWLEPR